MRKYNLIPPFNFPEVKFPIKPLKISSRQDTPIEKYMSIYAAHLYDSVILYAKVRSQEGYLTSPRSALKLGNPLSIFLHNKNSFSIIGSVSAADGHLGHLKTENIPRQQCVTLQALDQIIKEAASLGEDMSVRELARDGTRITKTIIGMGGYQSVSGNYIRIDSSGDSEGNFTAYALKRHNFTQISKFTGKTFTCSHYLMPVGEFHWHQDHFNATSNHSGTSSTKDLPEYSFNKRIDWPKGFKPLDEPVCGYQEEKCQGGKGMTEITAGVLGGLLVFALILTLSVYRKWKIEQEIEGLLWKINPESLQGHREGLHSCASRQSLGSMISGKVRLLLSSH